MEFLRKELEDLPEEVAQAALLALESAIRGIDQSYLEPELSAERFCARIHGILQFLRSFRKGTSNLG